MLTVFAIWAAGVAMTLVWLAREARRPITPADEYCARVDAEIDAARDRHPSRVAR